MKYSAFSQIRYGIIICLLLWIATAGDLSAQVVFEETQEFGYEQNASVDFADIDGDGDKDMIISGKTDDIDNNYATKLYENNEGSFTQIVDVPFIGVHNGVVSFADFDGDNDPDLLINGNTTSWGLPETKIYENDGGHFTEIIVTGNVSVLWRYQQSEIDIADVDGDNDLDIVMIRNQGNAVLLLINDNWTFTNYIINLTLENLGNGTVDFADFDGDNDPDILISGQSGFVCKTILYLNQNGEFSTDSSILLEPSGSSAADIADIDGDNDLDILIIGKPEVATGEYTATLYINDGNANFTTITDTPFTAFSDGTVNFADLDGDQDPDLFISGHNVFDGGVTKFYENNSGVFSEIDNPLVSFTGIYKPSVSFADVNNDSRLDAMLIGPTEAASGFTGSLFINNTTYLSTPSITTNQEAAFQVYPNPASDRLQLKSTDENCTTYTLVSATGQAIGQFIKVNDTYEFDVQKLPNGIYFIKACYSSQKILVNH